MQPFSIEGQSVSVKGKTEVTIESTASLTLKCGRVADPAVSRRA